MSGFVRGRYFSQERGHVAYNFSLSLPYRGSIFTTLRVHRCRGIEKKKEVRGEKKRPSH